jgi:heat shock protein HtpX
MDPQSPHDWLRQILNVGSRWSAALQTWAGAPDMAAGPHLDGAQVQAHNQRNRQQTLALGGGMALLLLCAAGLLAGWWGLMLALLSLAGMVLIGPKAAPESVMRTYGGELVSPNNGRAFLTLMDELARRAGLSRTPALYVIPSATLNAFAVGTREHAAVALTEGLIRRLQMRELAGVLAHEISHIRNGDLWIMGLADGITRIARILALSAVVLMVLNLVSIVTGQPGMSWIGLLLLYLTPAASSLLQQALSRTREFDADLDGVTLTGDAGGLASALTKLEVHLGRPWEDLVYGMRRVPQPCLLRSHPTTAERVERLKAVAPAGSWPKMAVVDGPLITGRAGYGASAMEPRYRWKVGAWY